MRDEIINIAVHEMKNGGYEHLNFADIAKKVGTSRANIHYHFKNKEGLAKIATEKHISEFMNFMNSIILSCDGDIVQIVKGIENYFIDSIILKDSRSSCVCSQIIKNSESPAFLRELAIDYFKRIQIKLESQIKKSIKNKVVVKNTTDKKLSFRLMTALHGLGQMDLVFEDKNYIVKQLKGTLTSIFE